MRKNAQLEAALWLLLGNRVAALLIVLSVVTILRYLMLSLLWRGFYLKRYARTIRKQHLPNPSPPASPPPTQQPSDEQPKSSRWDLARRAHPSTADMADGGRASNRNAWNQAIEAVKLRSALQKAMGALDVEAQIRLEQEELAEEEGKAHSLAAEDEERAAATEALRKRTASEETLVEVFGQSASSRASQGVEVESDAAEPTASTTAPRHVTFGASGLIPAGRSVRNIIGTAAGVPSSAAGVTTTGDEVSETTSRRRAGLVRQRSWQDNSGKATKAGFKRLPTALMFPNSEVAVLVVFSFGLVQQAMAVLGAFIGLGSHAVSVWLFLLALATLLALLAFYASQISMLARFSTLHAKTCWVPSKPPKDVAHVEDPFLSMLAKLRIVRPRNRRLGLFMTPDNDDGMNEPRRTIEAIRRAFSLCESVCWCSCLRACSLCGCGKARSHNELSWQRRMRSTHLNKGLTAGRSLEALGVWLGKDAAGSCMGVAYRMVLVLVQFVVCATIGFLSTHPFGHTQQGAIVKCAVLIGVLGFGVIFASAGAANDLYAGWVTSAVFLLEAASIAAMLEGALWSAELKHATGMHRENLLGYTLGLASLSAKLLAYSVYVPMIPIVYDVFLVPIVQRVWRARPRTWPGLLLAIIVAILAVPADLALKIFRATSKLVMKVAAGLFFLVMLVYKRCCRRRKKKRPSSAPPQMVAIVPNPPARVAPPAAPTRTRVPNTPPPREAWTPIRKAEHRLVTAGSRRVLEDALSKDEYMSMVAARLTGGVAASVVQLRRRHPREHWGLLLRMDGHGTWVVWEVLENGVAYLSGELRMGDRVVDLNGRGISSRLVLEEVDASTMLTLELGIVRKERIMTASSRGWRQRTSAPLSSGVGGSSMSRHAHGSGGWPPSSTSGATRRMESRDLAGFESFEEDIKQHHRGGSTPSGSSKLSASGTDSTMRRSTRHR